jgi:hypothetical protein
MSMNDKLSQLFKNTQDSEPSVGLEGFVLDKIEFLSAKRSKRNLIFSYVGLLGSVSVGFFAVLNFGGGIIESEFFSLLTLAFSDLGTVLANWKDFAYSLMETFPFIYTAIILVPIFTMLLSFNGYLNNHNNNKHYNTV